MVHHADVHKAVATLAALAAAGAHHANTPQSSYAYHIWNAPTSSDERAIRTQGLQPQAQRMSDSLFAALSGILGGAAPKLNFTSTGDPLTVNDFSTSSGRINVNPMGAWSFSDASSPYHNAATVDVPHEMAHLRQTIGVLSNLAQREGGAQAFADLVTPVAAQRANIAFTPGMTNDGAYADFVKQIQARPDAQSFILGGQFGHPAANWP